jgi:hypothetical protein
VALSLVSWAPLQEVEAAEQARRPFSLVLPWLVVWERA